MNEKKKELLTKFNKDNIIRVAKELFSEQGIERTTMDEIAKRADYSKSTIYVYFKSKDEIYSHILDENMCYLKKIIEESVSESHGFENNFYAICSSLVKFQLQYPAYFESLTAKVEVRRETMEKNPILKDIYITGEKINQIIVKVLQRGILENKVSDDIELIPTVFTLWSSICGIIFMSYKKEEYIVNLMKKSRNEFLDYSFRMLYKSIVK